MNSNLNKHEEKEKKPITVSWQDGDTTHVQTTVIHKRVPSALQASFSLPASRRLKRL